MAISTVSQMIYAKFIEAVTTDARIPKKVVERVKQLLQSGQLSDAQSVSALLQEVENTWRSSNP